MKMQVDLPFKVEYLTPGTVPIGEVIDSLISARSLIEEGGLNLPLFVPGLEVQNISIGVKRISQESPLKELFLVSLIIAFQKDLVQEIPAMIEGGTGMTIPDSFDTLVTVSVLIALFYGASYVKDVILKKRVDSPTRRQLEALIADLSKQTGRTPDEIRKILEDRYKAKSRIANLADATIKFFRPSKSQGNVPIIVSDRRIDSNTIYDVPDEYVYEEEIKTPKARHFHDVELEIHAQDRDKEAVGWAAIPRGIHEKRIRMKLVDGVTPQQIWNHDRIKGDGVIIYKRVGMEFVPTEIHLSRVRD